MKEGRREGERGYKEGSGSEKGKGITRGKTEGSKGEEHRKKR